MHAVSGAEAMPKFKNERLRVNTINYIYLNYFFYNLSLVIFIDPAIRHATRLKAETQAMGNRLRHRLLDRA